MHMIHRDLQSRLLAFRAVRGLFMSDSNDFTVISWSKVNSSIVGPDVFPTKSFSFVISQVKQLFIFL